MSRLGSNQDSKERRTKKLSGEEGAKSKLLAELEDVVRDAVSNGTEDLVLAQLIEITIRSINTKRELFDNPLHEPIFYRRYFRTWVQSAIEEEDAFDKFTNAALVNAGIKRE